MKVFSENKGISWSLPRIADAISANLGLKISVMLLLLNLNNLIAQGDDVLRSREVNRFISGIEILGGPSLLAPTLDSIYHTVYYSNNKLNKGVLTRHKNLVISLG